MGRGHGGGKPFEGWDPGELYKEVMGDRE